MKKFLPMLLLIFLFSIANSFASTKQEVLDNLDSIKRYIEKFKDNSEWMATVTPGGRAMFIPMNSKDYNGMIALDTVTQMEVQLQRSRQQELIVDQKDEE